LFLDFHSDIDDKIIRRGRQEYLLAEYAKNTSELRHIISDTTEAMDAYVHETLKTVDPDKKTMREKILTSVKAFIAELEVDIQANPSEANEHRDSLCSGAKDILYDWLDKKYMEDVNKASLDNEIFAQFARKWEEDYFKDMSALNVQVPDVLTRVSEYVPEIVDFIVQIISNGYAYVSNGSVYFDVQVYRKSESHMYAKLVPEAVGDAKALQEGEGKHPSLSVN
jgi:cysteinyl-tRNA synthetase